MQYIPIKTRTLEPPKDDLFGVLDESLEELKEGDVVLVTSKVVAIHQGYCIPSSSIEKSELIEKEADHVLKGTGNNKYYTSPITVKYHALFFGAGIDESNGNGYYIPLPKDPYKAAHDIWKYVKEKHSLQNLGVIITDSHSMPFRYGVLGISIGVWGFHPVVDHVGKKDLFGREMSLSTTNMADAIAAGSAAISGESNESTPIIIARDIPNISFTDTDVRDEILIPPEEDLYYLLLKPFYED